MRSQVPLRTALSLYLSLIFVFSIWAIVYFLFSKELLIGSFGLMQIASLAYASCSLGFMRALWPEDWPAWILNFNTSIFSIAAVSTANLFHIILNREFAPPRWIERIHASLLAMLPIKLALLALNQTSIALSLNMTEILLTPSVLLLSAILARGWAANNTKRPALSRHVVIGFYVLFLLLILVAALPGLGMIDGGEVGLYIVQVHGILSAFLILLMLQYRAHALQQQQRNTVLNLMQMQLQARQERAIREDQEKLLTMLAHELKTPLATIHMRLDANTSGSREIKQAIRDINGVIDRCVQTTQFGDRQLIPHREEVDVVSLVQEAISSCRQPDRVHLHAPKQCRLSTDRQLLFLVFNNLLENACKYAAPDTPILVRLKSDINLQHAGLQLEIANQQGPAGQPDADKVFSKYYRSPQARRQAGTGLGLYLVRTLMHTMGGCIEFMPDNTTVRFVLQLPNTPGNQ